MIRWRALYPVALIVVAILIVSRASGGAPASAANCPPAGTIAFGETVQCAIGIAGEQDSFTFSALAGDRVHVRVVDLSNGPLQPRVDVTGPNSTACGIDSATFAEMDCALKGTGINPYTVVVRDLATTSTGGYALYLQDVDAPGDPIAIAVGDTVAGAVTTPPRAITYTFDGAGGDRIHIRVADLSGGALQPEFRLYGPAGLICPASNATLAQLDCTLSGIGAHSYTLLIGDVAGISTGNYGLHLQRTRDAANPTTITSGETAAGHLASIPQMDTYTFRALAGTSATLTAINPVGGAFQPEIRVYGFGIICSANGNPAQTVCQLPGTGLNTYTVLVADFFGASTGYYCLALDAQPSCDSDGDTMPDEFDNCPNAANTNQLNTDANNLATHRPGADALGDVCDNDIDGDGYANAKETTPPLAENPLTYCATMRADVDGDGAVSVLDFAGVSPQFLQHVPPASARYDQDGDNVIGILDFATMSSVFLKHVSDCP